METTFSIIVPLYMRGKLSQLRRLRRLLLSIRNALNELPESIICKELVVVNDNPQWVLSKQFYDRFISPVVAPLPLLAVSNDNNLGQAYSRNRGAFLATGEYLHFIDQDDFISKNFYSTLLRQPCDFMLANIKVVSDNETYSKRYLKRTGQLYLQQCRRTTHLKPLLLSNIAFSPGQYILRKTTYFQWGGFPVLKNPGCDDYALLFNSVFFDSSFCFFDTVFFYYRMYPAQSKRTLDMQKSIQEFFDSVPVGKRSFTFTACRLAKNSSLGGFLSTLLMRSFFFHRIPEYIRG